MRIINDLYKTIYTEKLGPFTDNINNLVIDIMDSEMAAITGKN